MLSWLLDENIPFNIAHQITRENAAVPAVSVYDWRDGEFVGKSDLSLVRAAAQDHLTLVTYDLKTIPPLVAEMAADNERHAGVLFVDTAAIPSSSSADLARALRDLWAAEHQSEAGAGRLETWAANRVVYLSTLKVG